ncbi:MAG: protein kinase [Planctomycetota bacterium]
MTNESAAPAERVALAFQERYWRDEAEGRTASLSGYLELWPDHQRVVAREYLLLRGATAAAEEATETPDRVGPYLLEEEVGRGGQGLVYRAVDSRLGRTVALKVLTGLGPGAEKQIARFKREAEVTARLDHPGICGVHDAGIQDGRPFIAMRFVKGESLGERISRTRGESLDGAATSFLDLSVADDAPGAGESTEVDAIVARMERSQLDAMLLVFEKAARALHAAHEAGVVHRDVKPGNIMITDAGEPILLDFGLASDDSEDGQSLTMTGDLFGTPAYMSPEQIAGQRIHLDARSDVYSLGVTLYEALTLRRPWTAPTREALYQAIMTKEAPDPRRFNRAISRDLRVVLECALEKDRDRRYSSAEAFADDLAAVRKGLPVAAIQIGVLGRTWRWAKRRPARAALVAAIALGLPLVAGLAGIVWANREDIRDQELAVIAEKVEAHLERGFEQMESRNPESARPEFEAAIALDPSEPLAQAGRAYSFLMEEAPERALASLEAARAHLDPPDRLALVEAQVLETSGREREAAARRASAPPPADADGWFIAGLESGYRKTNASVEPTPRDRDAAEKAMQHYLRAVHAARSARLIYHLRLLSAAEYARDAETTSATADAIEALWSGSKVAWRGISAGVLPFDEARAIRAQRRAIELDPRDPTSLVGGGLLLARRGDRDEARDLLARAEALGLPDGTIRVRFAQAHLAAGDVEKARGLLEAYVDANPRSFTGRNVLAEARFEAGDGEGAVEVLRDLVADEPRSAVLARNLAQVLLQVGRYEESRAVARSTLELDDSAVTPRLLIVKADLKEDRLDEAREALAEALTHEFLGADDLMAASTHLIALGEPARALELLDTRPDIAGNSAGCWHQRGRALDLLGRYEESLAAFERCFELRPRGEGAASNVIVLNLKLQRWEKALEAYEEAMRLDPTDAVSIEQGCRALLRLGRDEETLRAAERFIELRPERAFGYGARALALEKLGRPAEAEESARRAIAIAPESADAHRALGVSLIRQKRADEGLASFREAYRLDPANELNLRNLRVMLVDRKLWPEAAPLLDAAIALDPDDAELRVERARCMFLSDRSRLDRGDLRRAVELEPGNARFHYMLALIEGEIGDSGASLPIFDHAIELARDDPRFAPDVATWERARALRISVRLEEIYAAEGLEAAIAAAEDFLERYPASEPIERKLSTLEADRALGEDERRERRIGLAISHDRIAREAASAPRRLRALLALAALRPEDSKVRNIVAWLKVDPEGDSSIRDPEGALPHAQEAVRLGGRRDANDLDTLGVTLFALGRVAEAIAVQEEVLRLMNGAPVKGLTVETAQDRLRRYRDAGASAEDGR